MQLTEDGRRFYGHCKLLVEKWQQIESEMNGTTIHPQGLLRVQLPQSLGVKKFNEALKKYLSRYESINVEWLLSDRMPDFLSDNLDCAIKVGNVDDPNLVAIKIAELPRVIVGSKEQFKNTTAFEHPKDLKHLPWLAFKLHYFNEVSLFNAETKQKYNLGIQPRFSTDNLFALREMVLMGMGVGVLSKWVIQEDLQNRKLIQFCINWQAPSLPVYLIYPQSSLKPAKLTKFIEILREHKSEV